MSRYYHICRSHVGKTCTIRTVGGKVYTGSITRVTSEHVYIAASGRGISSSEDSSKLASQAIDKSKKQKGEEVFFFAPLAIPLAAIIGLTIVGTAPFWGGYGPYYRRWYW